MTTKKRAPVTPTKKTAAARRADPRPQATATKPAHPTSNAKLAQRVDKLEHDLACMIWLWAEQRDQQMKQVAAALAKRMQPQVQDTILAKLRAGGSIDQLQLQQ